MFLDPKKILAHVHISPGMNVADFETGSGFFAFASAKLLKNDGRIYCIGSQSNLLERIASEAQREDIEILEIMRGHIEKKNGVPLKNAVLDLAIIANVLFSVDRKIETIKEAHRLLRKGGRVLFIEWADSFGGLGPRKDHVVPKIEAISLFKDSGFEIHSDLDAGSYHYSILFKKK